MYGTWIDLRKGDEIVCNFVFSA